MTYPMGRIGQHLERLDGIRLQRAVEDQEPCELKITFDLISRSVVNLSLAQFPFFN
jgi:hypothetical protein